jgi:hypothetical protein
LMRQSSPTSSCSTRPLRLCIQPMISFWPHILK